MRFLFFLLGSATTAVLMASLFAAAILSWHGDGLGAGVAAVLAMACVGGMQHLATRTVEHDLSHD